MKKLFLFLLFFAAGISFAESQIALRQRFFAAVEKNPAAAVKFLEDKDPEIRRYALYLVIKKDPAAALEILGRMSRDPDSFVRMTAVSALPELAKKHPEALKILQEVAAREKILAIKQIATRASWPFHREIKLLRNDPTWDYEVKTIKKIPLENLPWRFCTDPMQEGHLKGFFESSRDVSSWRKIRMGVWEKQGFPGYDGAAWYQIRFTMPEKMECNAVEIVFDGVDESAWVWLNGIYLGAHDMGPAGWQVPFAVDCRNEIRWGKENILTVRVFDAAFSGGIYKPLRVEILK